MSRSLRHARNEHSLGSNQTTHQLKDYYDSSFYLSQIEGSYRSAKKYSAILWPLYQPASVIDVGCGRGAWLKAFKDHGVARLCGIDGPWNAQTELIDQSIVFQCADLNKPLPEIQGDRFDLAMSLEVAEHLEMASASDFIRSLTRLSDVVLFGAAFTKQGGTNHINEQPHAYWAEIFLRHKYAPFDIFRPIVWGDRDIEFWYQQNTFLYVRSGSTLFDHLVHIGRHPVTNLQFLNCVHPYLFGNYANRSVTSMIKEQIVELIPISLRNVVRNFARRRIRSKLT